MRITTIIKKNFKVLIRSKTSALIVIFGPLLIIVLAGLAFNNFSSYVVKVGVFSTNYNELTTSFIDTLEERDFKVTKFETTELCVDSIKQGHIHACIIFPADFRLENDVSNEVTFYVDYSKTNLVYMILETVSSTIGMRAEELSLELTTQIINVLQFTKSTIISNKDTTESLITDSTSLQAKIDAMKLTSPTLSMTSLESNYKVLHTDVSKIRNDSQNLVEQVRELIIIVNNDNLTDDIEDEVNDLNQSILGKTNDAFDELEDLNSTINSFNKSLSTLEKNLGDARTLRQDSITLIANIKDGLSDMKTSLDDVVVKIETLKVTEAGTIVSPITTNIQPIVPEKTYLSYLFPSLVIMLILLIGIMLSSNLVIMEKTSRAYFRNFTTPTSDIIFIGANYLTTFIITISQVLIIWGIAALIFKTAFFAGIALRLLVVFLTITLFSFIGLIIGHLYSSEETASIASISIASLFLLLSNLILPLESMPETVIKIAQYNPFVIASELLKGARLFNIQIGDVYLDFVILAVYCVVVFGVLILVQQVSKFRFFRGVRHKKEVIEEPILKPEPKTEKIE